MRIFLKFSILIILASFSILNVHSTDFSNPKYATPDLSLIPEGCIAMIKSSGWGIVCPNTVDEEAARNARNAPSLILPGYSSNGYGVNKPNKTHRDYPTLCYPAKLRFTRHASEFAAAIRRDLLTTGWNILTAQAVHSLIRMIGPYTRKVDSEAMMIYRNSNRGTDEGDISCKQHYDYAYKEIDRLTHLIIRELNKGNRDLANTGLNLRTSPYNR